MILLDTHVLLWWIGGDTARVSKAAKEAIGREHADGRIFVSSVTAWEIAVLNSRGRIGLSAEISDWFRDVGRVTNLEFVPLDHEIAVDSTRLPGEFHKDPADRFIVATSRRLDAPLVTADEKILDYAHVKTIW